MYNLQQRSIELIQKPEVRNLLLISLVTGGIASAAAAMIGPHIDPSLELQKEIKVAIAVGTVTTLLGLGYKLYTTEMAAR